MVTLVAGAVAVGIVSVCAIPFGCFISRKIRKKVENQLELRNDDQEENSVLILDPVEVVDEAQYQIEEIPARPNSRRSPRVEIRVFVSNGSTRSIDVPSQGYITGSGVRESSSSQSEVPAQAIAARRRLSLQNLASGPAADVKNQAPKSNSFPMAAVRMCESVNQGLLNSDTTTKFEITITGPFSKSVTQHFGDFKNHVPDSSTPKSKSKSFENSENHRESDTQKSSFWKKASCNKNGQPKIFKTTRNIEIMNVEVLPEVEIRRRRNLRPELGIEAEEKGNCDRKESRNSELEDAANTAAGSSKENGRTCTDRGKWGLPGRFFDSFRESTSFATL